MSKLGDSLLTGIPGASPASSGNSAPARNNKQLILAVLAAVAALVAAGVLINHGRNALANDPGAASRSRDLIDSVSLKAYPDFRIRDGDSVPFKNPDTGQNTLYPAERCYYTQDGTVKGTPTYVLLNEYVAKEGETMCPDCGRKVVRHNPGPPPAEVIAAREREKNKR